jgi:hypothetical protein
MYLTILTLPLLSAIITGFLGRKIGNKGSYIISTIALVLCGLLSIITFYEVGISESPVSIKLISWIDLELLDINWGFYFDSLTVSMQLPIVIVSTCVHLYSIGYMNSDPHNQRFFSYLSLFTFFMLILISADNFLILFIGWEGSQKCLKWLYLNYNLINNESIELIQYTSIGLNLKRTFFSDGATNKRIFSLQRIGPHNIDILSIIIGSTLGNTHLEKRKKGKGTRIIFEQCSKNVEYLMWFYKYLNTRGYCSNKKPKLHKRIKKQGKIYYHYRLTSYTFSSFN